MSDRDEEALFERALEEVKACDRAGAAAEAMVANPALAAALDDLRREDPRATGPFLHRIGHLREQRDAPESERAIAATLDVPENPTAPTLPRMKVMLAEEQPALAAEEAPPPPGPPVAHVTAPSLEKRVELGIDEVSQAEGKTIGGLTMRLATVGRDDPTEVRPPMAKEEPWFWIAVVGLLVIAVPLVTLWLWAREPAGERRETAAPPPRETVMSAMTPAPLVVPPNVSESPALPEPPTQKDAVPSTATAEDPPPLKPSGKPPSFPPASKSSTSPTQSPPSGSAPPRWQPLNE